MRIFIKAKTKSKSPGVERIDDSHFVIAVTPAPEKGRANAAIEKALAEYLHIARSRVRIISGLTSSQKVAEILDA